MKNPLVVGYRGEIGSYILAGLIKYMPSATNILCFDTVEGMEEQQYRVAKADVIFLCVPLEETLTWLMLWGPSLEGKVVVEQTSLKSFIYKSATGVKLQDYLTRVTLLSMHILFRPSITPNREDQSIAIIAEGQSGLNAWFNFGVAQFIRDGLGVSFFAISTWKKHDQEMALQQALVHRVLLVLGEQISEGYTDKSNFFQRSNANTYIGKQVNRLALRIKQGDYGLYKLIQENPHLNRKLREFSTRLEKFDLAKQMKKVGDERQSTKKSR